jgi:methenyltetrahydrofolate cyclohydrolase
MDTITAFRQVLDPNDNSTGGGTASAFAGAMGAALAAMVARLSVGKGAGASDSAYEEVRAAGEALGEELASGAARDAEAFAAVTAAYRLPRVTAEQKSARTQAIQAAMIEAAQVPLRNAELCAQVLELVDQLEGRANPNALSDLQCAGYLARAGLSGCLANLAINLPSIKDPATVAGMEDRAQALRRASNRRNAAHAMNPQEAP